ncbi:MAG: hypothetical protein Q7T47_08125 [Anaerolineales bacterium]|nr:hypothetical protein [Anaerolineales bacterium]
MKRWPVKLKHIGIAIGLFILVVLVIDFNQRLAGLNRLSTQLATVHVEATAVMQTQIALVTQIAYATSERAVEEYAYKNGMGRSGDNPVQVVPAGTLAPTPIPLPAQQTQSLENWQIWWELFFGN